MIRVLEVTESLDCGGRETFVMNVLRNIDINRFHIDFYVLSSKDQYYTKEAKQYGCEILKSGTEQVNAGLMNFIKKNHILAKIVREKKYDVVHIHADTHLDYLKVILIRIKAKPRIILHAHGANELQSGSKRFLGRVCRFLGHGIPDINLACSTKAKTYMFKKVDNTQIIHNPMHVDDYLFNMKYRNEIREKYSIDDDEILVGHAGRFSKEKNHNFVIDTFSLLVKKGVKAKLILLGDGEERINIEKKIYELKLQDRVILPGVAKEVFKYYSAMDICWFPSFYESFGNVAVEAQVSGLPVIISKGISNEVLINENCLQLEYDSEQWINETIRLKRINHFDLSRFYAFDDKEVTARIEQIYQGF